MAEVNSSLKQIRDSYLAHGVLPYFLMSICPWLRSRTRIMRQGRDAGRATMRSGTAFELIYDGPG
jgi:hypothetical protein